MACGVWHEVHLLSIIKPELEKCFSYSELALGMPFMGDFPSVVHVSFQAM